MQKPKLLIIVLFQNLGEEYPYYAQSPAPPLPGILLAGLTPPIVDVEVLHEMVQPIDYNTDADFIALSFMDYLAPHAYEVARKFRALGKIVIGGGKFATTHPDEVQPHFDSILVGEAHALVDSSALPTDSPCSPSLSVERDRMAALKHPLLFPREGDRGDEFDRRRKSIWFHMVHDMVDGNLKPRYVAEVAPLLDNIPPPRYDLVESKFVTPIVVEASRGCPHPCTYCALNIKRTPYRTRLIADVIRDLTNTEKLPWHKRKMAMILDNNLGGDLVWAKELLREVAKLKFWGIGVQFSIECLRDDEFVELLARANCRMAFIGMESLNERSLAGVQKRQNKVVEYRAAFEKLHRRGILTFTGFMFALDEDTIDYYATLPERLAEVGTCVILPSISIPIYGTPLWQQMMAEDRIVDFNLSHYEGDHLVFRHKHLADEEIHKAYQRVNRIFFSWTNIIRRWVRFMSMQHRRESIPQFILKLLVTTFVYFKLSIFQRDHARKKIFEQLPVRERVGRSEAVRLVEAA